MALTNGARLDNYEILSAIGRGGMGEVWKAVDTKLGREVAIKTLPEQFSADGDRLARFDREAKLLASLNHPNIAAIYGLEKSGPTQFLVLELVDGETLAEIIQRGPVAAEEALKLSLQIAAALESAHERGVIHRDLKPANIKVTSQGKVKVLDFGLAKALEPSGPGSGSAPLDSPTMSLAATAQGIILGTAAYMSPEQARGASADTRADIWAFGCVLYEMLTGRRAFQGDHVTDILASVLARDPDYASLRSRLNPRLAETVCRCLEKDPKRRWQAIGDVRLELEHALATPGGLAVSAAGPQSRLPSLLPWAAAVLLAVAVWVLKPSPPEPRPVVRFEYEVPVGQAMRSPGRNVIAISPDDRYFAYNSTGGLYLRSMDTLTARLIAGTADNLTSPTFSPDGEWVAFWSPSGQLRKIAVSGGAPVILGTATNPFGVYWGEDGNILFGQTGGIMRVPADGGTPELVVRTERGEQADGPQMLPDGKTVLFSLTRVAGPTRWDQAEIVAQNLDSGQRTLILRGGSAARYVSTGHLIYALGNDLFAAPFDVKTLTAGGVVPLLQGVQRAAGAGANTGAANYSVSDRGTLVYLVGTTPASEVESILAIVDSTGKMRKLDVPPGQYRSPRVSPDGHQIAVETVAANGASAISIYDLAGKTAIRRLTQDDNSTRPVWTPDGKRVTFYSDREKPAGMFWQLADGSSLAERLTSASEGTIHIPESWSHDGRTLSFASILGNLSAGGGDWSIRTLSLDSKDKTSAFYDVPESNQFGSVFSPDGKWIAYASNEGGDLGTFGIYVQPFPSTGAKYEISRTGGAWPLWSPKGTELFYRLNTISAASTPTLNAVRISTAPSPAFSSEQTLPIRGFMIYQNYRDYDMLPNGSEFVVVIPATQPEVAPPSRPQIRAVVNWLEELRLRVASPQ